MALVVTDPETGQSYAMYVDPRTGESASTPISAEQAASAKSSGPVDEYGSVLYTIDFNPITGTVGAPTLANVPKEVASSSTFKDVNTATGGQLAELYQNINSGNVVTYTGQYNTPTMYLASTGREITMTPTSTPGVYLAGLNTGGGGYTVPVKVDSKGNVSIADTAVTNANNINYVSNPGGGGFFSGLAENLQMAAPYLAAGYLGTQVLPGLLSGAGVGGASAAALDAEFIAADALQLAGQGLAPAAIEQNLIAAGVDSLVAADAAQLALQGIGQSQMANLLVQSGGGGAGTLFTGAGLAGTAGGAGAAGAAGAGAAGAGGGGAGGALTGSALAKLAGGLLTPSLLRGLTGLGGGGGGDSNVNLPTPSNRAGVSTGSADYSPEYYQQLQQYYNAYMPTQPKDVATPLQQWYETEFTPDAGVTNKLFGV